MIFYLGVRSFYFLQVEFFEFLTVRINFVIPVFPLCVFQVRVFRIRIEALIQFYKPAF